MEAAKPVQILANLNEEKYSKKLNTLIESNLKKEYSVEFLSYSLFLEININLINDYRKINYNEKFTLDTIKNMSKYFLICESIKDVLVSIEPNFNKINLVEEKDKIKLIVPLNHPLCKEVIFIIPEIIKPFNQDEQNNSISELKNQIQEQNKIINRQQKIINDLIKRIENLENLNKKDQIDLYLEKSFSLKNSKIILKDYEIEKQIKRWIDPFKVMLFELIFRASRDGGGQGYDFHKFCDNKGPTLTLIKTQQEYIFGAYTPYDWKSELGHSPYNDYDSFLFSINSMRKFKKLRKGPSLYFNPEYGPCFGYNGSDFKINRVLTIGKAGKGNFVNNYELTNGKGGEFFVTEIEVYFVKFFN